MQVRNLKYTAGGMIEMEIDHPDYGWIPFAASPNDSEQLGRDLYTQAIAGALGAITPYIKPLALAQSEQLALIEAAYATANTANITYMTKSFQADEGSTTLMTKTLSILNALGGTSGVTWWDANNVPVPLTYAEFVTLGVNIFQRGQALFTTKQAKKEAIRAATTIQQVEAVTWI